MGQDYKLKCAYICVKYKDEGRRIEEFEDVEIAFERNEDVPDHLVYLYFTPKHQKELKFEIERNLSALQMDDKSDNILKIKITDPMIDIKFISPDIERLKFIYFFLNSLRNYLLIYQKDAIKVPYHRKHSTTSTTESKSPKKLLTTPVQKKKSRGEKINEKATQINQHRDRKMKRTGINKLEIVTVSPDKIETKKSIFESPQKKVKTETPKKSIVEDLVESPKPVSSRLKFITEPVTEKRNALLSPEEIRTSSSSSSSSSNNIELDEIFSPSTTQRPRSYLPTVLKSQASRTQNTYRSYSVFGSYYSQQSQRTLADYGGLQNLGNTCYMNAVLQSLMSLKPFIHDLNQSYLISSLKSEFYTSLQSILRKVEAKNNQPINPKAVKDAVAKTMDLFQGSTQQDAHEFLSGCLSLLEEEVDALLKKAASDDVRCPVNNNFTCYVEHTLVCPLCKVTSKKVESYHDFSLDIPAPTEKSLSVQELLFPCFVDNKLERKCDSCEQDGNSDAQHKIVALPRVLTLHLNRIKLDLTTKSPIKLKTPVQINKSIELGYFCDEEATDPAPFDHGTLPTITSVPKVTKRDPFAFTDEPSNYNETEALEKAIKESEEEEARRKKKAEEEEYQTVQISDSQDQLEQDIQKAIKLSLIEEPDVPIHYMNPMDQAEQEEQERRIQAMKEAGPSKQAKYYLHSLVVHKGENATRGHYVTNVYYPNEDKWKNFNDTVVKKVTEEEVLASTKDCYVLFYVHEKCWPKAKPSL